LLAACLRRKTGSVEKTVNTILALKDREDCLFTPHNAFNTEEALAEKARRSAEAIQSFMRYGKFPHEVPAR